MVHQAVGTPGRAMRPFAFRTIMLAAAVLALGTAPALTVEDRAESKVVTRGAERNAPVTPHVIDVDLRDLPRPQGWQPESVVESETPSRDAESLTEISRNFPGINYSSTKVPNPNGDVGPDHYIQVAGHALGTAVHVYDKALPTPSLESLFILDTLGSGDCADGEGDPVALYDRFAQRWVLTEVSDTGTLCFYISQTGDPISGGWLLYPFRPPEAPYKPKWIVWPTDANAGQGSYVATLYETEIPSLASYVGLYAVDRAAVLAGEPATFQRETLDLLPGFSLEHAAPADPEGPGAPPAGAPAIIVRHRDTEIHNGPPAPGDLLEMWNWQIDWNNETNSVLSQGPGIDTAEFDSTLCGTYYDPCFPQPGNVHSLSPERESIMWPLQYMNHGEHETLVGNFVTDVDGNDHGGLRWFELRRSAGGPWTLFQEGTYSIDSDHRFLAAGAMDQAGNIILGYNVVSPDATYPGLRYTGRLSADPPGVMSHPETSIQEGKSPNRDSGYGRQSAMSLDPEDDCTVWFTGEYNNSLDWSTRIASLRFAACGCEETPLPPSITTSIPGDNRIELVWNDSEMAEVTQYLILRSRDSGGPYELLVVVPDSSPGVADGPDYSWEDTEVSADTTYFYVIVAGDGAACESKRTNEVDATAIGACTLAPRFDGLRTLSEPLLDVCTLEAAWDHGVSECDGPVAYNVYRSTTAGFTPGPADLLIGGVTGTALSDTRALGDASAYHYVVRAVDLSNGVEDDNQVTRTGRPKGAPVAGSWLDDAGDTGVAAMTTTSPWHVDALMGHSAPLVYKTGKHGIWKACADLVSPPLHLRSGATLTFWTRYDLHSDRDKGEVQVSTDGGGSWERVPMAYPEYSTDDSDGCQLPEGYYLMGTHLGWTEYTADLSAWEAQDVLLRFQLSGFFGDAGDGWWIDEIAVTPVDVPGACSTSSGSLPVPDGSGGTRPMRAERASAGGDELRISWDATSCAASDYNLLHGDLAAVAAYTLNGSTCSMGTSGNHTWSGVPTGNLYFVVVGHDGSGTESSWGTDSAGMERNGPVSSGECSITDKEVTATCP